MIQGGFAGDAVVPPERRLEKFAGRNTCPTFNLNGDVRAAWTVLGYKDVGMRLMVSKNVCHGVAYDKALHERIRPVKDRNAGLAMIFEGMDLCLRKRPEGKLFHDPMAACVAIDERVCEFCEVEVYREKGEWGTRPKEGTGTMVSVSVNRQKFEAVLTLEE